MIPIGDTAHVRTIRAECRRIGDAELEVTDHLIDERPDRHTWVDEDALPSPGQELWFVNTCQAWREDGPLHQRVRAGDAAGLRAFSARGPRATGA